MPTIGLPSGPASDEIPSSHLDLIECPPEAAPHYGHARRISADIRRVVPRFPLSGPRSLDKLLTICQPPDIMPSTGSGRTPAGESATQVILSIFRINGLLLAAGDLLTADDGLTSARWQVLGAIALAGRPLTVPQIARRMGLTRQSVHPTVRRLVHDGLVAFESNTDHRRSPLVNLTQHGLTVYSAVDRRQARWVNRLAESIARSDLETTVRVVDEIGRRLESEDAGNRTVAGRERESPSKPRRRKR